MPEPLYRVVFVNQSDVFEVYAHQVSQSEMYGFIEVGEFVFGERSKLVVDPGEERLKNLFGSVKRSYIPMHAVIRIDEVERQEGPGKIVEFKGDKVTPFPMPFPSAGKGRTPPEN
ncbi:Conserved hypothetical protein [gamma proteobacterium HdN1]|nr:Conserved hypothetical protein [gamma proteobacterium HdN1]